MANQGERMQRRTVKGFSELGSNGMLAGMGWAADGWIDVWMFHYLTSYLTPHRYISVWALYRGLGNASIDDTSACSGGDVECYQEARVLDQRKKD